jgi:uncharacterized RDD family membrane protein YckC
MQQMTYPLASKGHRFGGYMLTAVLWPLTLGIGYFIWSLAIWGQGLTPAKQILKMQVYSTSTGKPATWGHMAIRQFLIPLSFALPGTLLVIITRVPVFSYVGSLIVLADAIVLLASQNNQRLTDMWAKTVVLNTANGPLNSNGQSYANVSNNYQAPSNFGNVQSEYQPMNNMSCPNCGRARQPRAAFCSNCGYNF